MRPPPEIEPEPEDAAAASTAVAAAPAGTANASAEWSKEKLSAEDYAKVEEMKEIEAAAAELLETDQLSMERKALRLLDSFLEPPITFPVSILPLLFDFSLFSQLTRATIKSLTRLPVLVASVADGLCRPRSTTADFQVRKVCSGRPGR